VSARRWQSCLRIARSDPPKSGSFASLHAWPQSVAIRKTPRILPVAPIKPKLSSSRPGWRSVNSPAQPRRHHHEPADRPHLRMDNLWQRREDGNWVAAEIVQRAPKSSKLNSSSSVHRPGKMTVNLVPCPLSAGVIFNSPRICFTSASTIFVPRPLQRTGSNSAGTPGPLSRTDSE
jgi:hypothetical protein